MWQIVDFTFYHFISYIVYFTFYISQIAAGPHGEGDDVATIGSRKENWDQTQRLFGNVARCQVSRIYQEQTKPKTKPNTKPNTNQTKANLIRLNPTQLVQLKLC